VPSAPTSTPVQLQPIVVAKLFEPTEEQWQRMAELRMSRPIALAEADLSNPFIYSREHGVIYIPLGHHTEARATLYAWRLGKTSYMELPHFTHLPQDAADAFMKFVPGAAFRSSVMAKEVHVWNARKVTPAERLAFGAVRSIDPAALG